MEESKKFPMPGKYPPFINNKELFKALSFVKAMVSEGKTDSYACEKAASYYKVAIADVAHELMRFRDWEHTSVEKGKNGNQSRTQESPNSGQTRF